MSESKVVLKNVRLAFPRLTKPSKVNDEGMPAFSAAFILESDSMEFEYNKNAMEKAMKHVAKEKWGQKAEALYKAIEANNKLALHDGNTKADIIGYAGNLFIGARSSPNAPPGLFRRDRSAIPRTPNEDGIVPSDVELYGGCYVNAIVNVWAQDNKHGKRINASLSGVQYLREGTPFVGTAPAYAEEFEQLDAGAFDDADGLA